MSKREQPMTHFFTMFAGQAFSLLGSELVQFALVWWLTQASDSATTLALALTVALLPQVFLGPFAGALVDRWNRRAVMMAADGAIALATLTLAALFALDVAQIWHVYVLMFIRATGGAFHWPAMQASTTLMVPQEHLTRVAGLNQALRGVANIAAPMLGALLLTALPLQSILALDVGTALLAIAPLCFIRVPQPASSGQKRSSVRSDLRQGLRFVWGWRGMTILIGLIALLHLLAMPAFLLIPLVVTQHFDGGALKLAWLQSASGGGVVLGGLLLSAWGGFRRRIVTALLAIFFMGLSVTSIGLIPASAFPLAVGAVFCIGFMDPIVGGSLQAVQQATVPPDMQGRVFTLVRSGTAIMSPLGMVIAGPVADAQGVQFWYLLTGVAMVLMSAGALFIPALVDMEQEPGATLQHSLQH
ncbi:MAG: MFS transporter [Delftia sp.]|nr:MFS transporter [Delftia sp.]